MDQKYRLTSKIKRCGGHILHQIQALKTFDTPKYIVCAGDFGGWVESEKNLSQIDDCWVFGQACVMGNAQVRDNAQVWGNAQVRGNAQVYDNAQVWDNAQVRGNAFVYDNAQVCDNAQVWGNAQVRGNAFVYGNARIFQNGDIRRSADYLVISPIGSRDGYTTFYRTSNHDIHVMCGCFSGAIDEFLGAVEKTHGDNHHGKMYQMAAELARTQIREEEEWIKNIGSLQK